MLAMHVELVESLYVSAVVCPCLIACSSVGSNTAQYTLILVANRTMRSLQRRLGSLWNDPLALPIRAEISSSINAFCDIVLPKYMNLSVTFSVLLSMVMVGAV